MKKSIDRRWKHDLFPKMPQSFADKLSAALPKEQVERGQTEATLYEPEKFRLRFWQTLAVTSLSLLTAACLLFAVFGAFWNRRRDTGDVAEDSVAANPTESVTATDAPVAPHHPEEDGSLIVGKWTLWKIDYNGLIVSASVGGAGMLYTLELRDDGTADLQANYTAKTTYAYTFDGSAVTLSAEGEDDVVLTYDAEADTLTAQKKGDGAKMILRREIPEEPAKPSAIGKWYRVTGLDMGIDITIRDDGTATVSGWRGSAELPFTYTEEDGELQFTCVSEMTHRTFTARYDEERDVLVVTMDGTTVDYHRPNAAVEGIWTLTGIDYNGTVTDTVLSAYAMQMYLAFSDDGTVTVTMFMGAEGDSEQMGYLVTGNRIELTAIEAEDMNSVPISKLVYDPQTDTLRLEYDTTAMAYDMALIFSRTPDAVIPEVQSAGDAEGEWFYQFKPDYLLYVTVGNSGTARLKITDSGETKQDTTYTYTVEDGTIRFASAYADPFTAAYDRDTDTLTVTLNDLSMPFQRIWKQYVGKWALAGIEKQGTGGETHLMSSASLVYAEFFENGTVTITNIYADSGTRVTYRYIAGKDGLIELRDGSVTVDRFVYDEKEDRLRVESPEQGGTLIFMRAPNVQIPLLPGEDAKDVDSLRNTVPEYFGLDAMMGLKVYVWQMTEDSYSCALLSAADRKTDAEIGGMNGVTIEQMRLILSTYDVPSKRISIVPFRNPLSSYWYEIDEAYTERITTLLKDDTQTIDAAVFDIDKDGSLETCRLENGPAAESRTVVFTVFRNGTVVYRNTFLLEPGKLQFVQGMNGQTWYITRTTVSMTDGSDVQADKITFWISDGRIRMQRSTWKEVEYWHADDPEWNMGFDSVPEE